jgi:hypothetical protein
LALIIGVGVLRRFVMTDGAACRGADQSVMTRDVTGYSANYGAFDAALGFCCASRGGNGESQDCGSDYRFHAFCSTHKSAKQSTGGLCVPVALEGLFQRAIRLERSASPAAA